MAKQYYCFLERFNNYFNRKIIKYENLADYQSNSLGSFIPVDSQGAMTPFDFNPNDNVTTEIIANDVPFEPDYFLLLDENQNIVQRWFCIEQKRNRQGQWLYQLKRDVVADNLDNLLDSPIFVQKGMLKEDDPFIVNDEGMSLNQIKVGEYYIRDRSQTAWIVGYLAKNAGGSDISIQVDKEDIVIDYKTLADIASAVGTTEGVLATLINFDNDTSNKTLISNSVSMYIDVAKQGGLGGYSYDPSVFEFSTNFETGSATGQDGNMQPRPYLFIGNKSHPNAFNPSTFRSAFLEAVKLNKSLWTAQISQILSRSYFFTQTQLDVLQSFNGSYIKYNGKYYKFNISASGSNTTTVEKIRNDGNSSAITQTANKTVELCAPMFLQTGVYDASKPNEYVIKKINSSETACIISLNYVSSSDFIPQLNTTISSSRKTTQDQECDIIAIPLNLAVVDNGNDYETIEAHSRIIASAISLNQNAKVYDLQLLPYCPIPNLVSDDNEIDITNLTEHEDYDLITKNISDSIVSYIYKSGMTFTPAGDGVWTVTGSVALPVPAGKTATITGVDPHYSASQGTVTGFTYSFVGNTVSVSFTWTGLDPSDYWMYVTIYINWYYTPETSFSGIIFYIQNSSFSTNIIVDSNFYGLNPSADSSKKVLSNCYMWRLVSPNYQGSFDFNIAKNGGRIDSFNVFCTYKPFTPTIKVAPNFNWLYGAEYKDNRGLLCGGDFSLPRVNDEWITYQLNNKNYQNIFNRDIQHLDFMQGLEMRNQLVSGGVGIFSDAVKGAGAGAMVGGGYGAIAGAVVGAGASAVGYGIDVDTMARTHRENKQLAIDKFNYQLGNVKALPYTLTKVGSFDVISKIFPIIEIYMCSNEEIIAFEKKIKYESMTVMRIGTLREFANFDDELHYFKGSLIRNDEIADDTHILNAIYEELLKGVYI